jgi:hypothetical protein
MLDRRYFLLTAGNTGLKALSQSIPPAAEPPIE